MISVFDSQVKNVKYFKTSFNLVPRLPVPPPWSWITDRPSLIVVFLLRVFSFFLYSVMVTIRIRVDVWVRTGQDGVTEKGPSTKYPAGYEKPHIRQYELRNRKYFLCFHTAIETLVEVWENAYAMAYNGVNLSMFSIQL